jgi:hypothetical protein
MINVTQSLRSSSWSGTFDFLKLYSRIFNAQVVAANALTLARQ